MNVERFDLYPVRIAFKTPFTHARFSRMQTRAVIVAARSTDGLVGFGEALPRDYVTGETIESVLTGAGPQLAARFAGQSFADVGDVVRRLRGELEGAGRHLAAFCAFEIALLDLAGQSFGVALGEVLGETAHPALPAGVVIGFDVATPALARHAAVLRLLGKRHVKVKVGLPDDHERLSIVADALAVPLRLDANGAFASATEAIRALRNLQPIPLASIEQPLPPDDVAGARRIREETGLPVMADEGLCTREDAERLIRERAADIFNIRIGKCGGVLASLDLVELARQAGVRCHLGTLAGETGILTRAAEVFGRFVGGFDCLDGKGQNHQLLLHDVLEDPRQAVSAPLSAAGLGVRVSLERVLAMT